MNNAEIVRINPADIPSDVYDAGCRILSKSIRSFFTDPKNRRGYEDWMKTPEGQRADLTKEEREKFDMEHVKGGIHENAKPDTEICRYHLHEMGDKVKPQGTERKYPHYHVITAVV